MYEYQIQGETKRKYSVAHVVRPRTETTNACLCFTLLSKMPTQKLWSRPPDERDPSRGVRLDLQENYDWKMDSTVLLRTIDPATALDNDPVSQPQWTYRRVPKVSSLRSFARIPSWR